MASDVLIIGGGVIGFSIARELKKRGVERITVLERGAPGTESSWAAAGMIAPNVEVGTDANFHRFCASSLELYPDLSLRLLDETGIDIELDTSGTLFVALTGHDVDELRKRFDHQSKADLPIERLSASDVRDCEPFASDRVLEGLFFPNDWQVENRKLLLAYQRFAEINDIGIAGGTEVSSLLTSGSRIVGASTSNGDYYAGTTVMATGAWTSLVKIDGNEFPVTIKPVRGQMLRFDAATRKIRRVIYSPRGYVVPRADGSVLAGATVEDAGFDKATTPEGIESISSGAIEIAPGLAKFPVGEKWAGLRPFAADGLPVLGEVPGYEGGFVATAHYRNGILLAPKTAEIIADSIVDGVDSELFEYFGTDRFTSKGVPASVI